MEKDILQLLAIMMSDNLYRQVYAGQIKLLFDMLEREQSRYPKDEPNLGIVGIIRKRNN